MNIDLAQIPNIREAIVDGIFYPQEKELLRQDILNFLNKTKGEPGKAQAIITPHASLEFAGSFMAEAYQAAASRTIDTVVILAPEHRNRTREAVLPDSFYFKTPLGMLEVNQKYTEDLLGCSTAIVKNDIPHLEEHCIEVQLPFIQVLFPKAGIVPILAGDQNPNTVKLLSNALQLTFKDVMDRTLFIATSNMTSLHKTEKFSGTERLFSLIQQKKCGEILESESLYGFKSCGSACIACLLSFGRQGEAHLLDSGNSRKMNPGSQNIVYYASIELTGG